MNIKDEIAKRRAACENLDTFTRYSTEKVEPMEKLLRMVAMRDRELSDARQMTEGMARENRRITGLFKVLLSDFRRDLSAEAAKLLDVAAKSMTPARFQLYYDALRVGRNTGAIARLRKERGEKRTDRKQVQRDLDKLKAAHRGLYDRLPAKVAARRRTDIDTDTLGGGHLESGCSMGGQHREAREILAQYIPDDQLHEAIAELTDAGLI